MLSAHSFWKWLWIRPALLLRIILALVTVYEYLLCYGSEQQWPKGHRTLAFCLLHGAQYLPFAWLGRSLSISTS